MKKKILLVLLCGVIILGITGCGSNKNEFEIGKESDVEVVKNDVSFSLIEETLTNTGATFILKNTSDTGIGYGSDYELEIKKDNVWHKINVELYFTSIGYTQKPNNEINIEIDWEHEYGKLNTGEYRIIKKVSYMNGDSSNQSYFYVSAEFKIK